MRRDTFERLIIFLAAIAVSIAFFATTFVFKRTMEIKRDYDHATTPLVAIIIEDSLC